MVALDIPKGNRFSLHRIEVEISGAGAERVAADFDFYRNRPKEEVVEPRYRVALWLVPGKPSANDLPSRAAERVFSDCVLYREGERLTYEYSGGAVLQVERGPRSSRARLVCTDPELQAEIAYLYLQSEIGRFLDEEGLHRVHALGIGLPNGKAALVLLPSGGGKSTLALELLQGEGCVLLSDDSPLVDRWGRVHPYLMRLSFRPGTELPDKWAAASAPFSRRKYGPKVLVPAAALPGASLPRPDDVFKPGFLILGSRHGALAEPALRPISRWRSALPLVRDLVVGLGLPQVAELVLSRGFRSLPGLAPTGASRMAAASAFLARAQSLHFALSRDPKANARFLLRELTERAR